MINALATVAKTMVACFAAVHGASMARTVPLSTGASVRGLKPGDERPLQAWPRTINKGQTATLSWFNPDVSEVLVEQAPKDRLCRPLLVPVGRFPAKASIQVSPGVTTMYVISCAGSNVRCAESITLNVRD